MLLDDLPVVKTLMFRKTLLLNHLLPSWKDSGQDHVHLDVPAAVDECGHHVDAVDQHHENDLQLPLVLMLCHLFLLTSLPLKKRRLRPKTTYVLFHHDDLVLMRCDLSHIFWPPRFACLFLPDF